MLPVVHDHAWVAKLYELVPELRAASKQVLPPVHAIRLSPVSARNQRRPTDLGVVRLTVEVLRSTTVAFLDLDLASIHVVTEIDAQRRVASELESGLAT